jgi:hypothetical protein
MSPAQMDRFAKPDRQAIAAAIAPPDRLRLSSTALQFSFVAGIRLSISREIDKLKSRNEYQGKSSTNCRRRPRKNVRMFGNGWRLMPFRETEALVAAVDEGFRSSDTGKSISIEGARELVRKCATRSA